ncbi:MAG: chorismate synthase [Alistipes sp.]|jgi:chorismate synthase|nr:chorismate synthase [Alistipes sp.]
MNSFGQNFRITIFGESHGEALGVVMDGVTPGIQLGADDFAADLARRRGGTAPGTTPRKEADTPGIVSGLLDGHTTGAPLTVMFRNANTRSADYANLADHPRPSHADLVAARKFRGFNDPRGGGHFSGRVTLGLVAAGVVAKKMLSPVAANGESARNGVVFSSETVEIAGCDDKNRFDEVIAEAMRDGDSVGGIIECRATGVPVGLGEPFFDSVESVAAHLLFSIPAVKGVEFGAGFGSARLRGSQNNDPIVDAQGKTASNNDGGINGGITNGNDIVLRVAIKPTASIAREQQTFNFATGEIAPLKIQGRHDACIALRAAVVVEAALAIALADLYR